MSSESIRPQELEINMIEGQETEEGRRPIGIFVPATPTEEEVREHELTHVPYRGWSKHCVAGKAITTPHRTCVTEAMTVPIISVDYLFLGMKERKREHRYWQE